MKTIKSPTLASKLLILPLLLACYSVSAQEAPPPPGILDYYSCTFNPGKDRDDLMAARDFYLKQSEKAGIAAPPAFLWTLVKGTGPVDVVWFDAHENLAAYAAYADASAGSAEIQAATDRFYSVITCQAGLSTIRPLHQREDVERGTGSVMISSSACMLKHGQDQQNVADLARHISGTMESMGDAAPMGAYIGSPITGGPNTPDLYLFNVNQSATSWTQFVGQLVTTPAGQMLGRHFRTVLDCSMSMWSSEWVVQPPED